LNGKNINKSNVVFDIGDTSMACPRNERQEHVYSLIEKFLIVPTPAVGQGSMSKRIFSRKEREINKETPFARCYMYIPG
jgi:hypothetical protein